MRNTALFADGERKNPVCKGRAQQVFSLFDHGFGSDP